MVNHVCDICGRCFNRKSNYDYHVNNKKNPCQNINRNFTKINQNSPKNQENQGIFPIIQGNFQQIQTFKTKHCDNLDNISDHLDDNSNLFCGHCGKTFVNIYSLNRHLDSRCKVKKLQDEEKENIFKMLLLRDEELKLHKDELKKRDEQIDLLTKMNLDLNEKINKLIDKVSSKNINNGTINNITQNFITSDQLCKFGSENISKIDNKLFSNVTNKIGKEIFLECAKNIYNNPNAPENKTMYISDISRDKCMTWSGKNWDLINIDKAFLIVEDQIKKYFDHNVEKYEKLKDPKIKKDFDTRIQKYYKIFYEEYDVGEEEPSPERIKLFQKSVSDDLIKFFYNIKDDVKNNFTRIQNNKIKLIESTNNNTNNINSTNISISKSEILESYSEIKPITELNIQKTRGRPRKKQFII